MLAVSSPVSEHGATPLFLGHLLQSHSTLSSVCGCCSLVPVSGPVLGTPCCCVTLTTDASLTGWGVVMNGCSAHVLWSSRHLMWHINCLEMLVVFQALKHFLPDLRCHHENPDACGPGFLRAGPSGEEPCTPYNTVPKIVLSTLPPLVFQGIGMQYWEACYLQRGLYIIFATLVTPEVGLEILIPLVSASWGLRTVEEVQVQYRDAVLAHMKELGL
ncbi:hypothetical protein M9458_006074, partial [Cirrhinus mrigala]